MVFKKKRVWHCLPGQPITELDEKVMYWENKGKTVPSRSLIKTPEQIEEYVVVVLSTQAFLTRLPSRYMLA